MGFAVLNPFSALFDRRSGVVGTSHDLYKLLTAGAMTTAGQAVTEASALNVSAVWTGTMIRARMFATLPVHVIQKDGRMSTQLPRHRVASLLRRPNGRHTKSDLFGLLEAHRTLRGNAFVWKDLVPDRQRHGHLRVARMVPLHPDQVEVDRAGDEFGPLKYTLHQKRGGKVEIPSLEMLHCRGISTDGMVGRSMIHDLREAIGGALATQEHANSLWTRDATPSVVLSHPKNLSAKAKEGMETSWQELYGPGKGKRRVAVLEEGMTLERLSLTPEDGQFLQTQQDIRAQIAAALMVPPHMMGLAEKATTWGSGISEMNLSLLTITLGPDIRMWEERLEADLLEPEEVDSGVQIRFNPAALQRGDIQTQIDTLTKGIDAGLYTPNDGLAWLDMNPYEGGDDHYRPSTSVRIGGDPQ